MPTNPDSPSISHSTVVRMDATGTSKTERDQLAVEEPLEIRIGNTPFVVTMRTPGHDDELAAGFLASEGIIRQRSDLKQISPCPSSPTPGNTIRLDLATDADTPRSNRHGAIASSCGVCGKTSIDDVHQRFPAIDSDLQVDRKLLLQLPGRMRQAQDTFDRTGGLHSAAIFNQSGELICLREDVGRHNALDKVIGHALLHGPWPLDHHILLVSGRVAFEIIQKSLAARIPVIAAVSAPSSLATSFALQSGQTLVGFLRHPTFNIYSHPQRIL